VRKFNVTNSATQRISIKKWG